MKTITKQIEIILESRITEQQDALSSKTRAQIAEHKKWMEDRRINPPDFQRKGVWER